MPGVGQGGEDPTSGTGSVKTCDLLHISPGRVGCPGGCVSVTKIQDGVRPAKVGINRCRIMTRQDICWGGLGSSTGFCKKVLSHGFSDTHIHVAFVARVVV